MKVNEEPEGSNDGGMVGSGNKTVVPLSRADICDVELAVDWTVKLILLHDRPPAPLEEVASNLNEEQLPTVDGIDNTTFGVVTTRGAATIKEDDDTLGQEAHEAPTLLLQGAVIAVSPTISILSPGFTQ